MDNLARQAYNQIDGFAPGSSQEAADKALILQAIRTFPDTILTRQCAFAHLTASALILNATQDRVLLAHHNIYRTWAWTGGHCDGDPDLFAVALRESLEETGLVNLEPVDRAILALDVLTVTGHNKHGAWVSAHLHLNASYVFIADETEPVAHRPGENSAVAWFPLRELEAVCGEPAIFTVYRKLTERAATRLR